MNPFAQVQVQAQTSTYLTHLELQLGQIDHAVQSGKTVTLVLTEGDRSLSLAIERDKVVMLDSQGVRSSTSKAGSLAHNATLTALMTHHYSFDLGDISRHVDSGYIETQIRSSARRADYQAEGATRALSSGTRVSSPDLPNPLLRPDGRDWVLGEDCSYRANDGYTITAKSGFRTDLASIPRIFWPLIAFHELSVAAPAFHDLIYRSAGAVGLPTGEVVPADKIFTRKEADDLFLELMTRAHIRYWKRNVVYLAVEVFGQSSWRKSGPEAQL